MSRKVVAFIVLGLLGNTVHGPFTNSSLAQGVHVRAPFVRVDVYPYGGVSVRAPLAGIDVPGRHYRYYPDSSVMGGRVGERPLFQRPCRRLRTLPR